MRRTCTYILCIFLLLTCAGHAQATSTDDPIAWSLDIGGDGLTTPAAMVAATTGGLFIVGSTDSESGDLGESLGGTDGFIVRLDTDGSILWQRRLGGSADDTFTTVIETHDGGCVAMGTTTSNDGDARASRGAMDAWLVRLDSEGEILWTKCLGGSLDDALTVLHMTEDGTLFACGRTQSRNGDLGANYGGWDAWALLISPDDGKPLGEQYRYGFAGDDAFTFALPIVDGWLLLGEVAEQVSTDAEGDPVYVGRAMVQIFTFDSATRWETPILLGDNGKNRILAAVETENGWLLAGETNSRSSLMPVLRGGQDIWLLSLRSSGSVAWQRSFGGARDERLHSVHAIPDGGYILLGETDSNDNYVFGAHGTESDVWAVKVTTATTTDAQIWQQPIGGSSASYAAGLLFAPDGSIVIAGTTLAQDGDIGRHLSMRTGFVTRLTANGNITDTFTVAPGEECTLLQITAYGGKAYLLGLIRTVRADGPVEHLWVAQLTEEGLFTN